MKKIILAVIGLVLMLVGLVGLIIPVMPGWVFIFIGLSLIAPKFSERLKRKILRRFFKKELVVIEPWKKFGARAGFTTKHFKLRLYKTDDLSDPANQGTFQGLFSTDPVALTHGVTASKFVYLNQVHEDHVAILEDEAQLKDQTFQHLPKTDAVLTNIRQLALLVMTADCLSIFMVAVSKDPLSVPWIGLVHAGWRGTEKKITAKAYRLILEKSKCAASDVRIVLGPSIGKDHYEVGSEFKNRFACFVREKAKRFHFDLAGENKRQLIEAGAPEKNILDLEICTICENEDFYSFRQEKDTAARMVSFIVKP